MVLTTQHQLMFLAIIDYTNIIDTTVTAGTNGAVRTPMTVNATTLDTGETLDFDGNNMTSPLTLIQLKVLTLLTVVQMLTLFMATVVLIELMVRKFSCIWC